MLELVRRRITALRSAVLTLGAVAGTLCLVATVIAPLAGVRPLIFLSGSMSPTIPAGSLALARTVDAASIEVGDIVTVPSGGNYVTHRVVDVTHGPGRATMMLRGDGNKVEDASAYDVASAPRTEIWVPHAGSAVAWFSHAPGVYVLAGWVALVLGTLRRRGNSSPQSPDRPSRPGRPKLVLTMGRLLTLAQRGPRGPRLASAATGAAMVAAAPLAAPAPAMAAWADTAQVSGTRLQTASIVPTVVTCTDLGSIVRLSWAARDGATQYLISYGGLGADRVENETVPSTGPLLKEFDSSREGRFDVVVRFGSDTWLSTRSNQVSYTKGSCG